MRKQGFLITGALIIIIVAIIILDNALYLKWSSYKVPSYPVAGSDEQITYRIDPQTILVSLDQGKNNVFMPASQESENYKPPLWESSSFTWNQQDHLKVATALHQFVWKEKLEDWELFNATFWATRRKNQSNGIDYAYLVFLHQKDKTYIVHALTIDLLNSEVQAGQGLYHDEGWKSFKLDQLKINSVDQALLMSDNNGGKRACLAVKDECRMRASLGSYLATHHFLGIPFYRYEANWIISYYSKPGDTIFQMLIDPGSGNYKIVIPGQ